MNIISVVKNPIVLGLVACVATYLYMKYQNDIKYKDDPKLKEPTSLLVPSVVGFGIFLLIAGYNQYGKCNTFASNPIPSNMLLSDALPFDNPTCHLVGSVSRIQVPDVFLEAY